MMNSLKGSGGADAPARLYAARHRGAVAELRRRPGRKFVFFYFLFDSKKKPVKPSKIQ